MAVLVLQLHFMSADFLPCKNGGKYFPRTSDGEQSGTAEMSRENAGLPRSHTTAVGPMIAKISEEAAEQPSVLAVDDCLADTQQRGVYLEALRIKVKVACPAEKVSCAVGPHIRHLQCALLTQL